MRNPLRKLDGFQLAALAFLLGGSTLSIWNLDRVLYGVTTEATVTATGPSFACVHIPRPCQNDVSVTYQDQGGVAHSATFYRLIPGRHEKAGDRLPIRYLPTEPRDVISLRPVDVLLNGFGIGTVLALVTLFVGRSREKFKYEYWKT